MECRWSYADVDWAEVTRILLDIRDDYKEIDLDDVVSALNLAIDVISDPSIRYDGERMVNHEIQSGVSKPESSQPIKSTFDVE